MNKLSLYGLSAVLAFGFAACDGYEEPNPAPTTNPQSPVLNAGNVTFTYALPTETADLEALAANGEMLKIATVKADSVAPGYTFSVKTSATSTYTWTVGETTDSRTVTFDVPTQTVLVSEEGAEQQVYDVTVDPNVLTGLYQKNVSYNPAAAAVNLSSVVYFDLVSGSSVVESSAVGNPDAPKTASFTMKPVEALQLEEEYYLIPSGDFAKAIKLTHSVTNPGQDIYDNPVFQVITECDGNFEWQIVPASVYAAGAVSDKNYAVWGPNNASAALAEGVLVAQKGDVKPATGKFAEQGTFQITFNFVEGTFNFVQAISTLWLPGNQQGWSPATATTIITNDYINFWGFAYLDGAFKFCGQPDWNPLNWGAGDEAGKLVANSSNNLNAPERGLYEVRVNLSELTYSIEHIKSWGVIGEATPGGWVDDTALTPNDDFTIWTGKVKLIGGKPFKFRANNDWAINLGGDMDNLSAGGDNITYDGSDKECTITLDLTQYPYFCTVE